MASCVLCCAEGINPPRVALYKVGRKGFYCKRHHQIAVNQQERSAKRLSDTYKQKY